MADETVNWANNDDVAGDVRTEMATTSQIIDVLGYRVCTEVRHGTDTSIPPLLMCNGIGASLEVLDELTDAIDGRRTVIRFDVPGTGGSPSPLLPYSIPVMARIAYKLVRKLGFTTIDVLGYSWGGTLAQQIAFDHRHECRRLILVATGTGAVMVPGKFRALSKMLTPRRYSDPEYFASVASQLYGGTVGRNPADMRELGERMKPVSWRGYAYQLLAGSVWTSVAALSAIRQPTMIIAGHDDPIIRSANARYMRAMMSNAEIYWHEGGHLDPITQSGRFASVIDTFLDTDRE